MTLDEAKATVAQFKHPVTNVPANAALTGPDALRLALALIEIIEAQDRSIAVLSQRLAKLEGGSHV